MNIKTGQGGVSIHSTNLQIILWNMMVECFLDRAQQLAQHVGTSIVTNKIMKQAIIYESLSSNGLGQQLQPYFEQTVADDVDFDTLPQIIKTRALIEWNNVSKLNIPGVTSSTLAKNASRYILNSNLVSESKEYDDEGDDEGDDENESINSFVCDCNICLELTNLEKFIITWKPTNNIHCIIYNAIQNL